MSDFLSVQSKLGTMADLQVLTSECHKNGISCCLDFVMNHTSEDHKWAKAARNGDEEARKRYFFFDNWDVPAQFEKTVPQVFTTATGNFTYLEDCGKIVMTTFYPFQWDLNYGNNVVFNDMVGYMLALANMGIDVIRLDAVPYIWKELGTSCRNLPKVHSLVRMMRMITEIVCPSVLLLGEVVMEASKVVSYFGTIEKPESHLLYNQVADVPRLCRRRVPFSLSVGVIIPHRNPEEQSSSATVAIVAGVNKRACHAGEDLNVTTMASTWHTVATKDTRLLRRQMNQLGELPKNYVFLNYLHCHDDIGWGLAYFSFSDKEQIAYFDGLKSGTNLFTGEEVRGLMTSLKPYGFLWLLLDDNKT